MIWQKHTLIFCIGLLPLLGHTQNDWSWSQFHYFGDTNYAQAGLSGDAHYEILSNKLTNALFNEAVYDGKISSETSAFMDDLDHDQYIRLSAGTSGSMWFRSNRKGKWRWLFGAGYYDKVLGAMKTGLAQLYLRGNGPYEDQTLSLGPSYLTYHSYQFAGGGIERSTNSSTWGITVQMIKSSRYAQLNMGYSTFYTAPYGTEINAPLAMRYDATNTSQPKLGAWYGTGYGINAYFQHQPSPDAPLIGFQIKDLGQIFYQGVNRWKMNDTLHFTGLDVDNILQLDDSLINGGDLDSIEALIGLQRVHPFTRANLPANIQVNYVHPIGEKASAHLCLRQYIRFGLPELNLGFAYRLTNWFTIEPTARIGGVSRFDLGLTAAINVKNQFQLIVKSEQFENLIVPQESTSQYLFVGGQLKF